MDWNILKGIREGTPIGATGFAVKVLQEGLVQIDETTYLFTTPYKGKTFKVEPNGPFVSSLLWACDKGAALRAYSLAIEEDSMRNPTAIPADLLPEGSDSTYGAILKALKRGNPKVCMETACFRVTTDGAFVHRMIDTERYVYYFRNFKHYESELPYAIRYMRV